MVTELATIGAAAAGTALVAAAATTQATLPPPAGVKPDFTPNEAAKAIAAARGMVVAARWRETAAEVRRLTGFELGELADQQPIGLPRLSAYLYAIGAEAGLSADEINRMLQQRFPSVEAKISAMEAALLEFSSLGGQVAHDFPARLLYDVLIEELGQDKLSYSQPGMCIDLVEKREVPACLSWLIGTRKVNIASVKFDTKYRYRSDYQQEFRIRLKHDFYLAHKVAIDRFLTFCRQVQERGLKLVNEVSADGESSQKFIVEFF